jgi:hypothetical protein
MRRQTFLAPFLFLLLSSTISSVDVPDAHRYPISAGPRFNAMLRCFVIFVPRHRDWDTPHICRA